MTLKFCSEYRDFVMFLSEFKVGSEAIVLDKDVEGCLLCKISSIVENGDVGNNSGYEADFIIPDGEFMVGVEVIRPENYPNEFKPLISEFFSNPTSVYC